IDKEIALGVNGKTFRCVEFGLQCGSGSIRRELEDRFAPETRCIGIARRVERQISCFDLTSKCASGSVGSELKDRVAVIVRCEEIACAVTSQIHTACEHLPGSLFPFLESALIPVWTEFENRAGVHVEHEQIACRIRRKAERQTNFAGKR